MCARANRRKNRPTDRPAECGRMSVHVMKCDSGMGREEVKGGKDFWGGWLPLLPSVHWLAGWLAD